MKRFFIISLVVINICLIKIIAQTNPDFEQGDLSGWSDSGTGTDIINSSSPRTGTFNLSYATNNSTNQRFENILTFEVPNNNYLHCVAWAVGENSNASASIAINNGSTWSSASSQNIGTTLSQMTHSRQNNTGSSQSFLIGLNSRKENASPATTLFWDDVVAYVSSNSTIDLTAPDAPTDVLATSNEIGTIITLTWTDGADAGTGSQEVLVLRTDGLGQSPPQLNDQARYSASGGANGPNTIGSWTVVGIVTTGTETFADNSVSSNTDYTYAVYMRDLAYNYSSGTSGDGTALPVELTSFSAEYANNTVKLNWETATETNNAGFEVQRQNSEPVQSEDEGWKVLTFIHGHGTTNSPKYYSYIDSDLPNADKVSYRLRQIDNDGTDAYSKIVEVDLGGITSVDDEMQFEFALEQNYPNPFNPVTTINFTLPNVGTTHELSLQAKLTVYNLLGQEVHTLVNEVKSAGSYQIQFDASDLPSGIYFYSLTYGNHNQTRKLALLK